MQRNSCRHARTLCAAVAVAATGLGFVSILPDHAAAATLYFDNNGTSSGYGTATGGSYSWDGNVWATATGGTTATAAWVQGSFARFNPTSANYSISVANDEQMAGMYETVSGVSLTVNATGSGTLDVVSGDQGFLVSGSASKITINAPISGPGGVAPELSGSLYLHGNNTYTGGTKIGYSGATLTYFNSANSFGTGPIVNLYSVSNSFAALLASGGSPISIANDFQITVSGNGFNFAGAANTPVISTAPWSLGANNLLLRNSGNGSSLTLTNTISGSAGVTLSANNDSSIIFSGNNSYTGTTTIAGLGGAGGGNATPRLVLGAANTIASSSSVALAGGILDPDGINQNMSATTLALLTSTNPSAIDFGAGVSEVDFANSSAVTWTGAVLNLANWTGGTDLLRFGTDSTGLTSAQLATIEFNGSGLGTAALDPNGYVIQLPEPASLSLLALAAPFLMGRRRRRRQA